MDSLAAETKRTDGAYPMFRIGFFIGSTRPAEFLQNAAGLAHHFIGWEAANHPESFDIAQDASRRMLSEVEAQVTPLLAFCKNAAGERVEGLAVIQ